MTHPFLSAQSEGVWMDKWRVHDAEKNYIEMQYGGNNKTTPNNQDNQNPGTADNVLAERLGKLESENKLLSGVVDGLKQVVKKLEERIVALEAGGTASKQAPADKEKVVENGIASDDDSDDFELFGSDDEEEDAEAEKLKEERLKAYAEKKAKKPTLIAKSNIILDVKPWDDETDMKVLEAEVRKITMEGLLWGASKFVAVGYGIKKLQISCVVEDDKVSTDDLEDQIIAIEDYVQSMDIAAFNKV